MSTGMLVAGTIIALVGVCLLWRENHSQRVGGAGAAFIGILTVACSFLVSSGS